MSYRAVEAVLRSSITPPTLKLTAVVLANCMNERTGQLNPSLARIAGQVGVNRRQAQRCVRKLIELRVLFVIANRKGGRPGVTPHYRLDLDRIASMQTKTDDTEDIPTDDTDVTPSEGEAAQTGDTDDQKGRHTGSKGVTPMTKRGDTHVTLTGKNRKEPELTGVRFLEIQPSSIATPAVAGSPPNNGLSGAGFAVRQTGPSTASTAWDAYAAAFEKHYDGVTPVRNKKVNGQFSKLVERLGDEATAVAAFYVGHPSQFYAVKGHSVDFLLADAEKLRMEWKRGRNVPEAKTNAAKGNKPPKTFDDTDYTAGLTGDGHA